MAIDEKDVSADAAPSATERDDAEAAPANGRSSLSLDDLRLRLDSPLFARDPGLAAPAQVPRLRELTWEHVVNPTSSVPVIPGDDADGGALKPVKIEDILSAPADPFASSSPTGLSPVAPGSSSPSAEDRTIVPATSESGELEPAAAPLQPRERPAAPALPSFAAMVSGELSEVPAVAHADSAGVSELVKPIEEPPPVARDTDPEVAGLAELILRSTPVTGMPRVEAVRDSLRGDTGVVPVVKVLADDPVSDTVTLTGSTPAFAPPAPATGVTPIPTGTVPVPPVSAAVPVVPPPPPVSMATPVVDAARPVTGVQPAVAMSAVEAELNRLAYLPDQEEAEGPVEVPEIAYSDLRAAEPVINAPVLSNAELYTPRQSAAPVRHTYTDLDDKAMPVPRRRKRHVVRKMFTFLVLASLLAGGLFAVKYYVLDKVKWPDDVAPLAAEVEQARGLSFDHDVPVVTVPGLELSTKIAESNLGVTDETRSTIESEWRALGLLTGPFDTQAVGLGAMVDSPAFYDPTTQTIYVADGLEPAVKDYAMRRALTMALLDQRFAWGDRIAGASPAVAVGTTALYDADALAVAQSLLDDTARDEVIAGLFGLIQDYQVSASPSPYGSYRSGRAGVSLWPYVESLDNEARDALEDGAVLTDAQMLDLRRLVSGESEQAGTAAQGMLFWYHVLAARLDDDQAWNAALGWVDDRLTAASPASPTSACVTARVQVGAATAPLAVDAFTAWAQAAPAESNTTVTATPGVDGAPTEILVNACDPGESVATNDGQPRLSMGAGPLRTEQFVRLVDGSSISPQLAACAVYQPGDAVTGADERGMVDPADGWNRPDAHPLPDPTGCVP